MIRFIDGDLLEFDKAEFIVHQCNCVTTTAAHLAKLVFDKYPWSDIYKDRTKSDKKETPGDIIIRKNPLGTYPSIIAVLGQIYPGKSIYKGVDDKESREVYFASGIKKIYEMKELKSVAFPDHIGCGAAGGNWETYKEIIVSYSETRPDVNTYVIRKI